MGKRNFSESEFVKGFLTTYAKNGGKLTAAEMLERTVGNNGYTVGQSFTLTGDIIVAERTIDGKTNTYLALPTEEGIELSLMSLMGVSSLKGYDLENEVEVEYDVKVGNKTEKRTRTVKSDLIADFDFTMVWAPPTRILLEMADLIHSGDYDLKGKTATYLGIAVKPRESKTAGDFGGEKFGAHYKRATESKLWSVE